MSASQAADAVLAAVGGRLTSLDLQLYGGAVLPCEGLAACGTALTELRLRLGIDRLMHIGPFKYGLQHTLQRRRRAGAPELREAAAEGLFQRKQPQPQPQTHLQPQQEQVHCQGQVRPGRAEQMATRWPDPTASDTTAVAVAAAAAGSAVAGRVEAPLASSAAGSAATVAAVPAAAGTKAVMAPGGGTSGGGGSGGGRPVPPAVAAIASLRRLRCLELYGSAIDRILDTPYRLLGITALRNLTRLRIDLPPNHDDIGGGAGGGRAAVHASVAWYGNAGDGTATPAATIDGAGAWRLGPLLASLTWLRDLDLGTSYALPPEALPSLASLSQLVQLRCGTILTPPPQHRQQQWQVPEELRSPADGAGGRAAEREMVAGAAPGPQPGLLLWLPLPPSLQQLRFAALPAVPVLAALACLPGLQTLGCEPASAAVVHTSAAVGDLGARRRQALASSGNDGGAAADGGAGGLSAPSTRAATPNVALTATATAATAKAGLVVAGAAGGNGHCTAFEVDKGQKGQDGLRPRAAPGLLGPGGDVGTAAAAPPSSLTRRPTCCTATATAATAAARSDVACSSSGSLGNGGAAAPEPLRLALAGEDFVHEHRLQAVGRPEEVAVAARLLRRLLPPAALRRLSLQPFARSPAMLEGPHAGWLSELAPLADVVEGVEMVAFLLAPGDLDALRGALPRLKTLSLFMCRLDADDVRRLQDAQPSLAFRMDASCEYAGAYGAYGGSEYGNGYGSAMDGEGSDEFVDEAEVADGEPEPQGFWPVAFELQRAYERALDVSDEEGDGDGDGEDRGEQEAGEEEEEEGAEYRGTGREEGDMEDVHEGMGGEAEGVLGGEAQREESVVSGAVVAED